MMKKALRLAEILQHGMAADREGRLADAERSYQAVLELRRDNFDSLHLLGLVRWQQRRHDDSPSLETIRHKLVENKKTCPLFDVERTCRHIEAAYATMWDIYLRGESPRSFRVEPN
jgi:hypothetical protein